MSWVLFFQIAFLMCLAIFGFWIAMVLKGNAMKEIEMISKGYIPKEQKVKL